MLYNLNVENIALIDKLKIEFTDGMNVLSGETGAGKSMIVNSMNLIVGERSNKEIIRSGQGKARVEAVFYVDTKEYEELFSSFGIPIEEELIVTRELSAGGKNTCRINGAAVNLSTLKHFMSHIVDLHGQHEHQSLLNPANHKEVLDRFAHDKVTPVINKIEEECLKLQENNKKLKEIGFDEGNKEQTIDFLKFQIDELSSAQIVQGELATLKEERDMLINAKEIVSSFSNAYETLYVGEDQNMSVLSAIKTAADAIGKFSHINSSYEDIRSRLLESYYALEETTTDIAYLSDSVVFDEERQQEVEERIFKINSLKRKYNAADEQDLLNCMYAFEERLNLLENADERYARIVKEIEQNKSKLYDYYIKLTEIRAKAGEGLKKLLLKELSELGIGGAKFEVRFEKLPPKDKIVFSQKSADNLEFYISTNAGEPNKPLSKTASGGEISRVMLAFKNILANIDKVSTLIFDEIDTGISGQMAHVVAQKMAQIAKHRQIICVTHLAQISAMADKNYLILKSSDGKKTKTSIKPLDEQETIKEISRLSGGLSTENALTLAKELIDNAKQIKEKM